MGSRKKQMADAIKEAKKHVAFAKLNNCPTSPRKMRLVADLVRGEKVEHALNILKFNQKEASGRLEKLSSRSCTQNKKTFKPRNNRSWSK